jgi:transcriptional regulator with GAF, ATPase, and Fis domain
MKPEIGFDSINDLIIRNNPVQETLQAISTQMMENKDIALARIWLIDKGDICATCTMRSECPNQESCLHLTASAGRNLGGESDWSGNEGKFRRIPIGVRKVGHVAATGESIKLDSLRVTKSTWIADQDWVETEKIEAFAAYALKFKGDTLGVLAVFSRKNISPESFAWLRVFADQASIAIANARAIEEVERLRNELREENEYLREEINEVTSNKNLIGESPAWKNVIQQIELVGSSEATVLLTGESGTGKELVARALHDASPRRDRQLVRVNCAAVTAELFESEFFGHTKGAFTGAVKDRIGRFQLADGGTIFLDEIGELPLGLQGKLLRVLQERQFERVGEDRTRTVDVRVIAATNRNLAAEVENGRFRQDLFYRISVFPIHLPPLRERISDIEPLAKHFLDQFTLQARCRPITLTAENLETLQDYWYPGNVRELQNMIERAVILSQCSKSKFTVSQVIEQVLVNDNPASPPRNPILTYPDLKDFERQNIIRSLQETNYKIYGTDGAAEMLRTKPTTLVSKIKALRIPMRPPPIRK